MLKMFAAHSVVVTLVFCTDFLKMLKGFPGSIIQILIIFHQLRKVLQIKVRKISRKYSYSRYYSLCIMLNKPKRLPTVSW